jgi:dUTP pyrophosphatase
MKLKIKKLNNLVPTPKYAHNGDAGLDLVATNRLDTDLYIEYGTGLCVEIPEGHVGLLFPRSSISKYHLSLANSVGVIDSGYRGEIRARFKRTSSTAHETLYNVGDKIVQLIIIPYPAIELEEVIDFTQTERDAGGFGSSGN